MNSFGRQKNVLISLIVYLLFSKHTEYDNSIWWD